MNYKLMATVGIGVILLLSVGIAKVFENEITCYIIDPSGNIIDTFKAPSEQACQNLIGACDSETCWNYANSVFAQAGLGDN